MGSSFVRPYKHEKTYVICNNKRVEVDLVWEVPGPIEYETPLSEKHLNARCITEIAGNFVYDPPIGVTLQVGHHVLNATFIVVSESINGGKEHHPVISTSIEVKKIEPVLIWADFIPNIDVGEPLSHIHLCATCENEIVGHFHYDPPIDHVFDEPGVFALSVHFTPADEIQSVVNEAWLRREITVKDAELIWETPNPIKYGTRLGRIQLNARTNHHVDGKIQYDPAANTLLPVGNHTLKAHIGRIEGTVQLQVNKATPNIAWQISEGLCVGDKLDAVNHLTALCGGGVKGTFTYNPAEGHCFAEVGKYTITATFTPTVEYSHNYALVEKELIVEVSDIAWDEPPSIFYGEPLTSRQLSALQPNNVPGKLVYSHKVGTILNPGQHTITATFTPAKHAKLLKRTAEPPKPLVKTVTLLVDKAPPEIVWKPKHTLCVGEALTEYHLNARCLTSKLGGMMVYDPPLGYRFQEPGVYTLTMVFTIMGEKRSFYKDGTHNISIDVDKANIMWEEPASLLIGQPLTELQLNAQCPDKIGVFVYDPGIGTILPAGEHTLRVQFYRDPRTRSVVMDFMDSDENEVVEEEADAASVTRLFQPTAKSVTIRVEKRAPEIVWEPLHSLCAGEALTEFHLNARCSASDVAGKFQYSPPLGHIFQIPGPQILTASFTVDESCGERYRDHTQSITIEVDKPVQVLWRDPARIAFGQPLSELQLNAQCVNRAGMFVYDPGMGTILPAGRHTLRVKFLRDARLKKYAGRLRDFAGPKNSDFPTAETAVTLIVDKAIPALLWQPPPPLVIGQHLSTRHLNARCQLDIQGSFFYEPGFGSDFKVAGTFPVSATFVPASSISDNYDRGHCTVNVSVRAVELSWEQPGPLVFGEALGKSQLNARCSLPDLDGELIYEPSFGRILDAGRHTLHVKFCVGDGDAAACVVGGVGPRLNDVSGVEESGGAEGSVAASSSSSSSSSSSLKTLASAQTFIVVHKATPKLQWVPTQSSLHVGDPLTAAGQLNATVGGGIEGHFFYDPPAGRAFTAPGEYELSVTFIPNDSFSGNYDPVGANVIIRVFRVDLLWAEPAAVVYGDALSEKQLNARCIDMDGGYEYHPSFGAVLTAGEHTLQVRFIPAQAQLSYGRSAYEASVRLKVEKATPGVVWDPPTQFFVGDSFTRELQNAFCTTGIDGDFFYEPGPGYRFSEAGEVQLSVSFVPEPSFQANYTDIKKVVVATVIFTQISWDPPAAIQYGTPLSESQLSAVVDRPGMLVYEPAIGAVLVPGNHVLRVTFHPAQDLTFQALRKQEFTSVLTKCVTLEVKRAQPMVVWDNCKTALVGQRLSNLYLNASVEGGIDGQFFYDPPLGTVFERPGDYDLSVTFVPSEAFSVYYEPGRKKMLVNVHDASITWSEPEPIVYGEALSEKQLNAQHSLSAVAIPAGGGRFEYTPSLGTMLPAGEHVLRARFIPVGVVLHESDAEEAFTRTTKLTVRKQVPTITWDITSCVHVHQRLNERHLNATCAQRIEGQFVYKPSFGESFSAIGRHELSVRLIPAAGCQDNYEECTKSLWLDVVGLSLLWEAPLSIDYGTPLSPANALTAFCEDQEGICLYDPEFGTILNAGNHVLKCKFYAYSTLPPAVVDAMLEAVAHDTTRNTQLQRLKTAIYSGKLTAAPVTASVTLTVRKLAPSLAWATPPPLYEDEPLTAAHLSCRCTSAVDGKFFYEPGLGYRFKEPGVYNVTATFFPVGRFLQNFCEASAVIQIEVESLQLIWHDPEPIVFGDALSELQLNAVCTSRDGVYVYSPSAGTVLDAGVHSLEVTFYPFLQVSNEIDSAASFSQVASSIVGFPLDGDSRPLFKTVLIEVAKFPTKLTWDGLKYLVVGEELTVQHLNAKCNHGTSGKYFYQPGLGTCFNEPGVQELLVTFVPSGLFRSNYETAERTVSIEVLDLSWRNPENIVFGEPLTEKQLNARSTASGGSLVYEPSLGTVLGAGVHTLSVLYFHQRGDDVGNTGPGGDLEYSMEFLGGDVETSMESIREDFECSLGSLRGDFDTSMESFRGDFLSSVISLPLPPQEPLHRLEVQITVEKCVPAILWDLGTVFIGEELTNDHLNAVCDPNIEGTFEYDPSVGHTFDSQGRHEIKVTFTPAEGLNANYLPAEKIIRVNVIDVNSLRLEWRDPEQIIFGAALTPLQLNAHCSNCRGKFSYDPPLGTVLDAGYHPLLVTFSPLSRQITLTKTVNLWVAKAAPELFWEVDGDKQGFQVGWEASTAYESVLLPDNVEGTLDFDPSLNHIFDHPGPQTLTVTFTPSETYQDNYALSRMSRIISVAEGDVVEWAQPEPIEFGETLSKKQLNASCATRSGIFKYLPTMGALLDAGEHMLKVVFVPDQKPPAKMLLGTQERIGRRNGVLGSHKPAAPTITRTVSLSVRKATPRLSWTDVPSLHVGESLSAAHLKARCLDEIEGSFSYFPSVGFRFHEDRPKTLSVVFTPAPSYEHNYNEARMSISLELEAIDITWEAPKPMTYGEALSEQQLNAFAPCWEGTFVYSPKLGTLLAAGEHSLHVVFHPEKKRPVGEKGRKYLRDGNAEGENGVIDKISPAVATVIVRVEKFVPRLEWSKVPDMYLGQALSEEHLCAVCIDEVEGVFEYAPRAGQRLHQPGHNTLTVTFTPSAKYSANYNESKLAVRVTVERMEVEWESPEPIVFGEALGDKQLRARCASRLGVFFYSPPDGTILDAGDHTLRVFFHPMYKRRVDDFRRPADNAKDEISEPDLETRVEASVLLRVHKAVPRLSWGELPPLCLHCSITNKHLNTVCDDDITGTFEYEPALGYRYREEGNKVLTAVFTPSPQHARNYSPAQLTATTVVRRMEVAWPTPEPMRFGEPLSESQLNARCEMWDGVFFYYPEAGTKLNLGLHTVRVVFFPAPDVDEDTDVDENIVPIDAAVTIEVLKAIPKLAWVDVPVLYLGEALSVDHLKAVCKSPDVHGSFAYDPGNGYRFDEEGPKTLNVVFVPSPQFRANYEETRMSITVVVHSLDLVWENPAPIWYGEGLTEKQLDAVCRNCEGVFVYSAEVGTMLPVGTHFIEAEFFPRMSMRQAQETLLQRTRMKIPSSIPTGKLLFATRISTRIAIMKATPELSWGDVPELFVGESVTQRHLNAICTTAISGRFVYKPDIGHRFTESGMQELQVSFFPSKFYEANYSAAYMTIRVVVHPLQVLWDSPQPIDYGQALTEKILNASCLGSEGIYHYEPCAGVTLPVGLHKLQVTFHPLETAPPVSATPEEEEAEKYPEFVEKALQALRKTDPHVRLMSPIIQKVFLAVNKATPTVIWNPPQRMIMGEALNAEHYNAKCPMSAVGGTFFYDPPVGHRFSNLGRYTLSVVFVPSRLFQRNYCEVRQTAEIEVVSPLMPQTSRSAPMPSEATASSASLHSTSGGRKGGLAGAGAVGALSRSSTPRRSNSSPVKLKTSR